MAVDFLCGLECGTLAAHWGTLTGSPVAQTTVKRTGSYALEVTPAAVENAPTPTLTATQHRVVSFYFRFSAFPSTSTYYTICNVQAGAGSSGGIQVNNSAVVQGYMGASVQNGPTLSVDTWYRADLYIDASTTTNVLHWKIDGVDQTDASLAQAANNMTSFRFGSASQTGPFAMYIDDVMSATTAAEYPLTHSVIRGFSPNADGTHTTTSTNMVKGTTATPIGTAITSATTDAYQWVDDVPVSGTAEFWNFQTASSLQYGEVAFPDSTDGAPLAVSAILALSAASTAACNFKGQLYDGVTADDIAAAGTIGVQHPTLTYQRKMYTSAPSGAWTEALFNALRVRWGFGVDATPDGYLNAVFLEAAFGSGTLYTPSAFAGALTFAGSLARRDNKALSGGMTPAGAIAKRDNKALSGGVTPSGSLLKRASTALSGALTFAGSLVSSKLQFKSLEAALTFTGALLKRENKGLSASITTSGSLVRRASKALAGGLSFSGAVSTTRTILQSFTGALTTSGSLAKRTDRALAGSLSFSGSIAKSIRRALAGALEFAGSLLGERSGQETPGDATLTLTNTNSASLTATASHAASLTLTNTHAASLILDRIYDFNDTITVAVSFAVSGTATDPTTVTLRVYKPDGDVDVYTYAQAEITKSGTGSYTKSITADQRGVWLFRYEGTGTCQAAVEDTATVRS